jgi:hypothetical protein
MSFSFILQDDYDYNNYGYNSDGYDSHNNDENEYYAKYHGIKIVWKVAIINIMEVFSRNNNVSWWLFKDGF